MIPYKQLSLADVFEEDKPQFLSLLEQHIDLSKYIPLRDFCGFKKVPDSSKITSFKQDFLSDLQSVFDNLVDVMEPICQTIDAAKADMAIFDSSGIEAFVQGNNPKYADRIICQLKAYMKTLDKNSSFDPTRLPTKYALPCLFKPGNKTALCQWTFLLCVQVWHYYKRSRNHPPYFFL